MAQITNIVRKTTLELLQILKLHKNGIFEDAIEEVYENIYHKKFETITGLSLKTYIKTLAGFKFKNSLLDGRPYIKAKKYVIQGSARWLPGKC